MTDEFQQTLSMDPLLEAEKLTGKSYKDDPITQALGFMFLQKKTEYMRDELSLRNDTYRHCGFEYAIRIMDDLGFRVLHEETYSMSENRDNETHLILWRDGILATADSYTTLPEYGGVSLNSINLYGNWLPNANIKSFKFTSSGHFSRNAPGFDGEIETDPWIWIGHWSGSEGVRNTLDRLDNNGTWLSCWLEQPVLNLDNFTVTSTKSKTRDDDWLSTRRDMTQKRLALLPKSVQEAVQGTKVDA